MVDFTKPTLGLDSQDVSRSCKKCCDLLFEYRSTYIPPYKSHIHLDNCLPDQLCTHHCCSNTLWCGNSCKCCNMYFRSLDSTNYISLLLTISLWVWKPSI